MDQRPGKSAELGDWEPWQAFWAEPALHVGEEEWYADPLVTVAGDRYPPRFRMALTCDRTRVEVCVPVHVELGAFLLPEGPGVNPSTCAAEHGKAVYGVTTGRVPPLARAITVVPDAIRVTPDGCWEWVDNGWGWYGPSFEWYPDRLAEVKRRMNGSWVNEVLPTLREIADYMRFRNLTSSQLITELRNKHYSRSKAYELLRECRETGLIPPEPVHQERAETR